MDFVAHKNLLSETSSSFCQSDHIGSDVNIIRSNCILYENKTLYSGPTLMDFGARSLYELRSVHSSTFSIDKLHVDGVLLSRTQQNPVPNEEYR